MNQSEIFLHALFTGKPDDQYILIWTLADKRSHWFQKVGDAIQLVESLGNQDVYVGTGLSARDHGPINRCKSDEIAGSIGLFVDIDLRSDAHPNAMLPGTIEDALSILLADFPQSFVILTGNGVHAWWLFREPHIFENDDDRKWAAALAKRWNTLIRDNGSMKGWKIDRLGDLARVLRIPGTTNCKDPSNAKKVSIYSSSDRRYNPSDLSDFLDELGIDDDESEECARQRWADQFRDKPLKIDLDATIPQERLDHWIASDSRFKTTWFRQRSDLKDQSQSGYDMALAGFGFRVGLKAQEIVDLMVQHRRIYKGKPRTTPDYFSRTLTKAAQHSQTAEQSGPAGEPAPFAETADAEAGSGTQARPLGSQPKSNTEKIDLCKSISAAFGVEVLRLVKVSGDEPLFRMDLAEGSIAFPNVGKLISQSAVRTAIAGKVGRLIPYFKQAQWRVLVQMMLDACVIEDGGEELQSQGAARLQIGQYLAETAFISCIEGAAPQDLRKPMVREDQIAVCASDLQLYINKARSQAASLPVVVGILSAAGAKVERVRGKKFKEQSRWMLPLEHFDPADYDSAVQKGSAQHD